jgi:hypothetical protein
LSAPLSSPHPCVRAAPTLPASSCLHRSRAAVFLEHGQRAAELGRAVARALWSTSPSTS